MNSACYLIQLIMLDPGLFFAMIHFNIKVKISRRSDAWFRSYAERARAWRVIHEFGYVRQPLKKLFFLHNERFNSYQNLPPYSRHIYLQKSITTPSPILPPMRPNLAISILDPYTSHFTNSAMSGQNRKNIFSPDRGIQSISKFATIEPSCRSTKVYY
jgi:hypothetical protein